MTDSGISAYGEELPLAGDRVRHRYSGIDYTVSGHRDNCGRLEVLCVNLMGETWAWQVDELRILARASRDRCNCDHGPVKCGREMFAGRCYVCHNEGKGCPVQFGLYQAVIEENRNWDKKMEEMFEEAVGKLRQRKKL